MRFQGVERIAVASLLFVVGCSVLFPDPIKHAPPSPVVVDDGETHSACPVFEHAKAVQLFRAGEWRKIVDDIKTGKIKTVSEVAARSYAADRFACDQFNQAVQSWLEKELGGADEDLPANAASVFQQVADGFERAAK